ncbi:MAG: pilus assembly protein N-terminal domain-containing protein [Deltaproteobacteria bacterium]|nr:pilus assembly protein N-terminal domain-containing protein [Deltaproteobacteria bacterium]
MTRKRLLLMAVPLALIPFLLLFFSSKSFGRIEDQDLVIGRAITVTTTYEIGDVAMSDSSVCNYVIRENRRELYLNPTKEGTTSMTIWDQTDQKQDTFTIRVVAVSLDTVRSTAEEFAGQIPGVRVMVSGDQVILLGEVYSPLYLKQVNDFVQTQKKVVSQVTLSAKAMEVIAKRIEEAVATPGIKVRTVRDQLIMEGITYSADQLKKIDTIAKLYAPEIINLIEMKQSDRRPGYEQTVKLDVYFMEIKNSALRRFGIHWAPGSTVTSDSGGGASGGGGGGGGDGLGIAAGINALMGTVLNLFPKIEWLHQTGRGRVLEKPSFIVKSGEEASFFSGMEVPYKTDTEIEFKEVGATITASPIVYNDAVDLKITVKISSLSATVSGAIDRDEMTTSIYVQSGESVVLGGLLRNNDVKTFNKPPDKIDTTTALFPLFFSRDFQTNKSQFYVFITPRAIEKPDSAEAHLKRWLEINKEIELTRKAQ